MNKPISKRATKSNKRRISHSPKGQETKNQLLLQAAELFSKHGYNGIGLQEIASTAGVTKGSLYYHFKGKHELYTESVLLVVSMAYEQAGMPELVDSTDRDLTRYLNWILSVMKGSSLTRRLLLHMIIDHDVELMKRLMDGPMGRSLEVFMGILKGTKIKKDRAVLAYFVYSICILNDELAVIADTWLPDLRDKLSGIKAARYLETMVNSW